ncbi:hypothetical protein [Chloroflexus sp.]
MIIRLVIGIVFLILLLHAVIVLFVIDLANLLASCRGDRSCGFGVRAHW